MVRVVRCRPVGVLKMTDDSGDAPKALVLPFDNGLIESELPVQPGIKSISGHSMGGHGALICGLKNPGAYRAVSALTSICNPSVGRWCQTCFKADLGGNQEDWQEYDATSLVGAGAAPIPILIDSGSADEYLIKQLYPQNLQAACQARDFPLTLCMQKDYDHSYYFVATLIGEHLAYHADKLHGVLTNAG